MTTVQIGRQWNRVTAGRDGAAWVEVLKKVRHGVIRDTIARMVWWDFFGDRSREERWPELDKAIDGYSECKVRKQTILDNLILVGYPAHVAEKRVQSYGFWGNYGRKRRAGSGGGNG